VSADAVGNVVNSKFENPGPSKYFSRLSMEAARQWKFNPPQAAGESVPSEWVLRFEYTNSGTQVTAAQVVPKS
jgi:outer membrane biosynthesis protein TonB